MSKVIGQAPMLAEFLEVNEIVPQEQALYYAERICTLLADKIMDFGEFGLDLFPARSEDWRAGFAIGISGTAALIAGDGLEAEAL